MRLALALTLFAATAAGAQVPLPNGGEAVREGVHLLEFTAGGGLVALAVDAADPGRQPAEAVDASTQLHWVNGVGEAAKLTVSTVCPGQQFALSIGLQVTSWGSGTQASPGPAVPLLDGMLATDLVRDIPATEPEREGTAVVTYRASATVADGTSADHGDDLHTVTFTFLAQ